MVPKDVIFVIDVSGSMIGTKIKQVKWQSQLHIKLMDHQRLFKKETRNFLKYDNMLLELM